MKTFAQYTLKSFFVFVFFLLSGTALNATHIVGGQLSYVHVEDNEYQLVLQMWRDCCNLCSDLPTEIFLTIRNPAGQGINEFGNVSNAGILVPATFFDIVDTSEDDPCFTDVPDICIEVGLYRVNVTLPGDPGTYEVSTQTCCRNGTIVNIFDPTGQGATYAIDIPHNTLAENNNSAVFLYYPPEIICLGSQLIYDHSAFDADGDSLVYSLYTPFDDGNGPGFSNMTDPNYQPIQWLGAFSVDNQMGGSPPLTIDPITGLLTANPDAEGQYVVGIQVTEYRDGVAISVNRRDFQFNVTPCEQVQVTTGIGQDVIDLINVGEYEVNSCTGWFYTFEETSVGNVSNQVQTDWIGMDEIPGIIFDNNTEFLDPFVVFPGNGTYELQLVASIGDCADTANIIFNMFQLDADFLNSNGCGDNTIDFVNLSDLSDVDSVRWNFGDINATTTDNVSLDVNPSHTYTQPGSYLVSLTVFKNECSGETIDTVVIGPPFSAQLNEDNTIEICRGESVPLEGIIDGGDSGQVTIEWQPASLIADPTGTLNSVVPEEDTWIIFRAETSTGCEDIDSVLIKVYDYPDIQLADEIGLCEGELTLIEASVTGDYTSVSWSPSLDLTGANTLTPTADPAGETTYTVTVNNEFCPETASVTLAPVASVSVDLLTPNQTICEGDEVILEAVSGSTVTWLGGDLDNSNTLTQTISPSATTTYEVSVGNDCFDDVKSVTIEVDTQPIIDAGEDVIIGFDEVGQLNGAANVPIVWSPPAGLTDPTNPQTSAQPSQTTTYTMTAINGECSAEDAMKVTVSAEISITVPTGFSPNGDGQNDALVFFTNGIESVESFTVFSRWGEQLYAGTGFDAAWDGFFESEEQPVGVYVYYIVAKTVFGDEFIESGNATLIR